MTPVERVARAIYPTIYLTNWPEDDAPWSVVQRACALDAARAALAAMREPSEGMLSEARDVIWGFSQDYAPHDLDPAGDVEDSAENVAKHAYRAMIDKALEEG